jgi:hypothetical protein
VIAAADPAARERRPGPGASKRRRSISFFRSATGPKSVAPVGQTSAHAAYLPSPSRCWQSWHFEIFGNGVSYVNRGTPNGHAATQYRQPMQASTLYFTMPVVGSLVIADTGQADTHDGSTQCMHDTLVNAKPSFS